MAVADYFSNAALERQSTPMKLAALDMCGSRAASQIGEN